MLLYRYILFVLNLNICNFIKANNAIKQIKRRGFNPLNNETSLTTVTVPENIYQTISPPLDSNLFCWSSGGAILLLNKIKHTIQGYVSPRTFSINEIERSVKYDFSVVALWNFFLNNYCGDDFSVKDKTILELGPGADLGVGLILLSLGAKKYNSLDINNLVDTVPDELYEELFATINKQDNTVRTVEVLSHQLELTKNNKNDSLNYVCDPLFNTSRFKDEGIDLVLSNAAFEHFDDLETTFAQLTSIVRPGGTLLAEIDLSTHTRWIRDKDPLNIYRYSPFYYDKLKFSGSPNRVRPYQYAEYLERNGWSNIKIIPYRTLEKSYVNHVKPHLSKCFQSSDNTMEALSVILCATR